MIPTGFHGFLALALEGQDCIQDSMDSRRGPGLYTGFHGFLALEGHDCIQDP